MLGFLPAIPSALRSPILETAAPRTVTPPEGEVTQQQLDLAQIDSVDVFNAISVPAGDLVANGRVAKFLIDIRSESPQVHFVNGNYLEDGVVPDSAKYHFFFARQALSITEDLGEFNQITYFTEPKTRYVAGVVHTYFLEGGTDPVYGLQFYPQDIIREQAIVDAVRAVKEKITTVGARFAFVPTGTQQTTSSVGPDLVAAGIEVIPLDRILGSITYLPLNPGEAWGYLRIFPPDNDELNPSDIPVFDELPLDLSVVAGVMTRAVQDASSHVNLKSKERGTPNMVLRNAGPENARLVPWKNKPLHLVVRTDDFVLERSTDEEVASRLAERNNLPWVPLVWEAEKKLRSFGEMAAGELGDSLAMSARYGGKAANLGFLVHRSTLGRANQKGTPSQRLGYDLVPKGFGVPLSFYRNLVQHKPNGKLRKRLDKLIRAEMAGTLSSAQRTRRAAEVQELFLDARIPPKDLAKIEAKLEKVLAGVDRIKVRSSANAEDIPNFDGAGLHDSYAATRSRRDNKDRPCSIEIDSDGNEVKRKVKPKTLACAIKGVYASLWNKRAIEERSFARIDHATAAMGLAIVPVYDAESEVAANAVAITRVLNTTGVYGYTLSLQDGNNLVTNPDPGTWSEVTIAALGVGEEPTSLTITRYAKPSPEAPERTEPVLPREKMLGLVDIVVAVERSYCAAKPGYYPGNCRFVVVDNEKPKSLDLELKVLADGQFVCKQVREFGGR